MKTEQRFPHPESRAFAPLRKLEHCAAQKSPAPIPASLFLFIGRLLCGPFSLLPERQVAVFTDHLNIPR